MDWMSKKQGDKKGSKEVKEPKFKTVDDLAAACEDDDQDEEVGNPAAKTSEEDRER